MSTPIDDGGPAFPRTPPVYELGLVTGQGSMGMSLRDWLAGQSDIPWNAAMDTLRLQKKNTGNTIVTIEELLAYRAKLKYMEADAMLAARKGGGK